jgi:ABC-type nitrate/sulfonate/bicarbonate transport system ATPase subunit
MILTVDNLSFGFEPYQKVLNHITLTANATETVAIVGASGCGKSTFLRLLCGIYQQDKKHFWEGNIVVNDFSPAEYTRQGKVGFMFQEPTLFPNLTVRENVALPLKFKNERDDQAVNDLIETVGLKDFAHYLPAQLSGGMKTRVALARTFITKPALLLMDEPFGALDIRWKFLLYRELETLRKAYAPIVVIVTHDIQEALLLSNHIVVFGKGGTILQEIKIQKPLPRVFQTDAIKDLQDEYLNIQNAIMND